MNYQQQLETKEWKDKREEVFKRDCYKCTKCKLERPKILGILRNPGIIDSCEFSKSGRVYVGLENNKAHLMFYYGMTLYADSFVIGDITNVKIEDLKFAEQRIDGVSRQICFTDNVTNKDLRPDLHVHHKYYILGKKAWEYNNDALITLCADCHMEEHQNNAIIVYSEKGDELYEAQTCYKCNGAGYLKEYNYYCNGVCFSCNGEGVVFLNGY